MKSDGWKKITALGLAVMLLFALAACSFETEESGADGGAALGSRAETTEITSAPGREDGVAEGALAESGEEDGHSAEGAVGKAGEEPASEQEGSNILVAYYSWADNAVIEGEVDTVASPSVAAPGNVGQLAGWVQEQTGGDLFAIQVTEPYPSGWDECLERANRERGEAARPELMESVEDMDRYEIIFLGFPTWWYGAPMAVLSFLESYDFSGKQVYLFCSHGTGRLAGSVEEIAASLRAAEISEDIFDCYEEEAADSRQEILDWLEGLGY